MGSITIPNLDDALEQRLRSQADSHGCSMEDEARDILDAALNREPPRADSHGRSIEEARGTLDAAPNWEPRAGGLVASIRAKIAPLGGVDLPVIPRGPGRELPFQDE